MDFVMGSGGVPAGSYRVKFVGAEEYNENADKYGPGVATKFEVVEGEHTGAEVSRITSVKMSPKSALGKMAVAIKGSPIAKGEAFSFEPYIGVTGTVIVESTDNGGSRVSAFLRDAQAAPTPVPQEF